MLVTILLVCALLSFVLGAGRVAFTRGTPDWDQLGKALVVASLLVYLTMGVKT